MSRTELIHVASRLKTAGDLLDNLGAVEPAVLDEDRAGVDAGDRASGDEQTRYVCLERLGGVQRRLSLVDHHALAIVPVWLGVIVPHVWKIFARNPENDGVIVVPDRHHDVPRVPDSTDATTGSRFHSEDDVRLFRTRSP